MSKKIVFLALIIMVVAVGCTFTINATPPMENNNAMEKDVDEMDERLMKVEKVFWPFINQVSEAQKRQRNGAPPQQNPSN